MDKKVISLGERSVKKGRYMMDYSKKYGEPYDVNEKAKEHMRKLKQLKGDN